MGRYTDEDYQDQYDEYEDGYDEEEEEEFRYIPSWLRDAPYWAISTVMHLILFAILYSILLDMPPPEKKQQPIKIKPAPEQKKDDYDPTRKRDMKKTRKILDPTLVDKPIIERQLDEVTPEIPKGSDLNNLTNVDLQSDAISDAIGVGAGAAGAYGARWGKGSLVSEGGGAGTEEAVRAALEWLRRHQSSDGSWKAKGYTEMCTKRCRSKDEKRYGPGRGFEHHDIGVTALAILAFAGYGHTHQDGQYPEYVEVLKRAVKYMKSVQVKSDDPNENGRYGSDEEEQWIYDHSIATMAMGELLAMSGDVINLKRSVTDAVKLCLRAQNTGFGWKYGIKPGNNDTSVTGWMVLALKTAKNANIDVPKSDFDRAFEGALNWFVRSTSVANGKTGYEAPGDEGSMLTGAYSQDNYPYSKELSCMTAVAVLCRLFAGQSRGDAAIKRGVDILMKETPQWVEQKGKQLSKVNVYYWYYGSYAMFQFGGSLWNKWNEDMKNALLPTQRQEFDPETKQPLDEDGSWDPIGEWGMAGGRVYSTAIGAMTLEVYYRFVRASRGQGL